MASFIHNCVQCSTLRGTLLHQKLVDLPKDRVEETTVFTNCDFDCFGPFTVKDGHTELKRYGLIFTCMNSRGIHLELLDDMTTDTFINGLRSFIALQRPVQNLYSGQGSNIYVICTENELNLEKIKMVPELDVCNFHFNAPAASHMGGVRERLIGTVKDVLKGITFAHPGRLDTASLRTLLYEWCGYSKWATTDF